MYRRERCERLIQKSENFSVAISMLLNGSTNQFSGNSEHLVLYGLGNVALNLLLGLLQMQTA